MKTRDSIIISISLYIMSTNVAQAYLDPGTGSMIFQGLIAGIAAAIAIIPIYYQKIKMAISNFFRNSGNDAENDGSTKDK